MVRASIPNVVLAFALCGCGSAVFYEEVPDSDLAAAQTPDEGWKEAGALGPGPRFEEGISCEDSIAIARARVLRGLEAAKGLGYHDRQTCLARKAQALAALAAIEREDPEEGDSCVAARGVFAEAAHCGEVSPAIESASLEDRE